MKKTVKIIEQTKDENSDKIIDGSQKRRVAAYARVSTGSEEQATSFNNQVDEWQKRITSNPDYEFVKVYTDEGISGTSAKKRVGFNEMMEDARLGKFDLILCKSISRFARNTTLAIQSIRELKEVGVEVFFDNERLSSFDPKSEFLFSVMCSMAQEESRHISENVSWTFHKKMKDGIPFVNTNRFLGYDKNETKDQLIINPEEAEIVKLIFDLYDNGNGCLKICKVLQDRGIKTVVGGTKWHTSTVTGILRNEKYVGDLLQQKTFTVSYLGHTRKMNTGQKQQFFIENDHEPIITREQFNRVQEKLNANSTKQIGPNKDRAKFNFRYPLSGTLICMNCGNTYKRRTWNSGLPCQKSAYQCNSYVIHSPTGEWCHTKAVSEKLTNQACCDIINNVYLGNSKIFTRMATLIKSTMSSDSLALEEAAKIKQKEKISKEIDQLLKDRLNAESLDLKEKIDEQYGLLVSKYERIDNAITNLQERAQKLSSSKERMKGMLKMLNKKKIEPEMLTKEMVGIFFYRILVCSATELVFAIDITHTMKLNEFIENRKEIATRESIYSNEVSGNDPKPTTIKYKVVLI